MNKPHIIDVLSAMSAEELHRWNLKAFQEGNQSHYHLINGILVLERTGRHKDVGYSCALQYCKVHFQYKASMAAECRRVAEALEVLPALSTAFCVGAIGWTAVRQLARVAEPETEAEWL